MAKHENVLVGTPSQVQESAICRTNSRVAQLSMAPWLMTMTLCIMMERDDEYFRRAKRIAGPPNLLPKVICKSRSYLA
jgi:hypothetical protein